MNLLIRASAILALATTSGVGAQQIPGPYGPQVTLAQARDLVDAAKRAARERNFTMAFAVALPSGEPILLEVMDGTQTGSIAIAPAKARTAARFRRPTKAFADGVASGNLGALTLEGIVAVEGGVPIVVSGRVIGALGVSGGTSQQDGEIAAAALAATKLQ